MQSNAQFVEQYLASLPEDRRIAIEKIRSVILANLDGNIEEGMQYGMIGYYVPHRIYPAGYHCDPKQPLPYAGLASQKNHMSIYMMTIYGDSGHLKWFTDAWKKTGKKLDMGKSCIRFKKLEDVALEVIGEAFKRVSASAYIAKYEQVLNRPRHVAKEQLTSKKQKTKQVIVKKVGLKKPATSKITASKNAIVKMSDTPPTKRKSAKKPIKNVAKNK